MYVCETGADLLRGEKQPLCSISTHFVTTFTLSSAKMEPMWDLFSTFSSEKPHVILFSVQPHTGI